MKVKPKIVNNPSCLPNVSSRDVILQSLHYEPRKDGVVAYVFRQQVESTRYVITVGHSTYMSVQEARMEILKLQNALKEGKSPRALILSFEEGIALAHQSIEKDATSSQLADLKKQNSRLRALSDLFLGKKMISITAQDIKHELQAYKNTGVSDATVNRLLSAISRIYRIINSLGHEIPNRCLEVKRLAENNIRTNTLPPETATLYIKLVQQDHNWLAGSALNLMLYTGIRCGNAISMTVDMISPCLGYIHLDMTKSGKPLTVSVAEPLKPLLQELIDHAKQKKSRFLFPSNSRSTGHISAPRGAHDRAIAKLNAMGFNVICTIHDLRRTFANQLLRASGGNVYLVSQALGHGSVAVTMRYLSIRSDELDEAVNLATASFGLESLAA